MVIRNGKRGIILAISMIVLGIIIFLLGILTPVNDLFTMPVSIILIVFGIVRLLKKK